MAAASSRFYRQLPQATTDDIEMRACRDQNAFNEDIAIEKVKIYSLTTPDHTMYQQLQPNPVCASVAYIVHPYPIPQ
jgi:hypothetical protein